MRTKERAMEWAEIAQRIKRRRMELDLTQQDAARAAGIGSGTWFAIEKPTRDTFDEKTVRGVCRALGWPPNQIAVWRGEDSELEPAPKTPTVDILPGVQREFNDVRQRLVALESGVEDIREIVSALSETLRRGPNGNAVAT